MAQIHVRYFNIYDNDFIDPENMDDESEALEQFINSCERDGLILEAVACEAFPVYRFFFRELVKDGLH